MKGDFHSTNAKMRFWKLCQGKQKVINPSVMPAIKVENPLQLDYDSSDKLTLKALEAVIIDSLITVHYGIEDAKHKLAIQMRSGSTDQVRAFLARKTHLLDKKFMLEQKLEKVQAKLRAFE